MKRSKALLAEHVKRNAGYVLWMREVCHSLGKGIVHIVDRFDPAHRLDVMNTITDLVRHRNGYLARRGAQVLTLGLNRGRMLES